MTQMALDTNILVRYIAQDDKRQSVIANKIIESLEAKNPAFLSVIVLCEINWVLKSAYKVSKKDRINILNTIIFSAVFEIEKAAACYTALKAYEKGKADFSDYIIATLCKMKGCTKILTFDQNPYKSEGFFINAEKY